VCFEEMKKRKNRGIFWSKEGALFGLRVNVMPRSIRSRFVLEKSRNQ
jgi:hypothetical protein